MPDQRNLYGINIKFLNNFFLTCYFNFIAVEMLPLSAIF